jgi:hypothetical protein
MGGRRFARRTGESTAPTRAFPYERTSGSSTTPSLSLRTAVGMTGGWVGLYAALKRRSFAVLSTIRVGVFIKTKSNVKRNGQECLFHIGGRPYMSCGDGGEIKVPRCARNDNVETASLMATLWAGRRFAARTGESPVPTRAFPHERTAGSSTSPSLSLRTAVGMTGGAGRCFMLR